MLPLKHKVMDLDIVPFMEIYKEHLHNPNNKKIKDSLLHDVERALSNRFLDMGKHLRGLK